MAFKETVVDYLKKRGVQVSRVEQDGDNESIVCHVPQSDNIKVANLRDVMEKALNVAVLQSDSFGMNVVIVESNDLE